MTTGTQNVQKIAMLRRASLAPALQRQLSSAAAVTAAVLDEGLYEGTAAMMAAAAAQVSTFFGCWVDCGSCDWRVRQVLDSAEPAAKPLAAAKITPAQARRAREAVDAEVEQRVARAAARGRGAEARASNEDKSKTYKDAGPANMAEAEAAVQRKQFEVPRRRSLRPLVVRCRHNSVCTRLPAS
jgi:bacterioferritin-associated ferredoxin